MRSTAATLGIGRARHIAPPARLTLRTTPMSSAIASELSSADAVGVDHPAPARIPVDPLVELPERRLGEAGAGRLRTPAQHLDRIERCLLPHGGELARPPPRSTRSARPLVGERLQGRRHHLLGGDGAHVDQGDVAALP